MTVRDGRGQLTALFGAAAEESRAPGRFDPARVGGKESTAQ